MSRALQMGVVASTGGGGGGAFTPADLSPHLHFDPANYDSGTGNWPDDGSVGGDLAQATASKRPGKTASNAAFNSNPTVDFDGSDDVLKSPTFGAAIAQPHQLAVVLRFGGSTGHQFMVDSNGSPYFRHLSGHKASAGTELNGGTGVGSLEAWCIKLNGSSSAIYRGDWGPGGAAASGTIGANSWPDFILGSNEPESLPWSGSMGDVIMWPGVSNTDRDNLRQWINAKYGLAIGWTP